MKSIHRHQSSGQIPPGRCGVPQCLCRLQPPRGQAGSILMLVLFVCLAVAVVIQALCTVILCAERAMVDEAVGRTRLEEKDQGLVALRQRALVNWEAVPWTAVREEEGAVEGSLSELEDGAGWVMSAVVRQKPTVSRLVTSAWIERGRDGIDLPLAALVAGTVKANPDRELPWMEVDLSGGGDAAGPERGAVGYVEIVPEDPVLGEGCSFAPLSEPWRLDPGWLELDSRAEIEAQIVAGATVGDDAAAASMPAVAPSPQVAVLTAGFGRTVRFPADIGRGAPDTPVMVILSGGADLDARNSGNLYGVLVVDDGSLFLDGTTVHGAVFVTDTVSLGATGRILFSRSVLRWATDRSLNRARLVPGTRWEGME